MPTLRPLVADVSGNIRPLTINGLPLNLPNGTLLNGAPIGPGGGGGIWGSITGTLSNQSDLNTALGGKQPLDSDLTSIAALSTTGFGRGFLTLADAAASRTYIGAGTSSFSGLFTGLDFTGSNLTSIATRNFSSLQNIPTTVAGYGITDVKALSRQTFSNANVTVSAGTTTLAQTGTMSATRTVTLPAASAYASGTGFTLIDESATVINTKCFSVVRAGSDTLNGGTSAVMVIEPIAYFQSDGTSKWFVATDGDRFVSASGQAHFKTLNVNGNPGTIETVGVVDFFGIDGVSGTTFDFTNNNNDDNNFHIKGINSTIISSPFRVNGRGTITLGDDNDVTLGYDLTISLPTFSASRNQTWANGDGTIALAGNSIGQITDGSAALLVKPAVAVVATSNLTLSGEQTIDGITTSGSLVLCTAQTTGANNGPWVSNIGAWTRPTWYSTGSTTQAPQFLTTFVRLGTTYSGSTWRMTTAAVTIGTTATTWAHTPISLESSNVTGTLPAANVTNPLNQNTTGSAASLSISGQTGLLTVTGLTSTNRAKTVRDAADTILELGGSYTPTGTWTSLTLVTPALGTPASGVVTNLTGTASININGTVGATTPTTGAFTTLTNTGAATNSKSGAASTPAYLVSGVPFAGTGTTSFPLVYINDANATASTTLNTAGTYFGVNGDGTQDLMNLLKDGTSQFKISSTGVVSIANGTKSAPTVTPIGQTNGFYWRDGVAIYSYAVSGNVLAEFTNGAFQLSSTQKVGWSSGNPDTASIDTSLYRNAAGVVEINNGTAGSAAGSINAGRTVLNKTSNYTVINGDKNTLFTNAGASGEVDFILPTAAAGLTYTYYVDAAQTLKVIAGASTTIRIAGSVSASAGNITNATIGGSVTLVAISTTKWIATDSQGTWTVN